MNKVPAPDKELLLSVRLAFIGKGSSLNRWCMEHAVDRSFASKCLQGAYAYPSAKALRARILKAAGVTDASKKKRTKSASDVSAVMDGAA